MKSLFTIISTLLISSAATALTPPIPENLFTCTFDGGKQTVEISMIDTAPLPKVTYSFGKTGEEPELNLVAVFQPAYSDDGYYLWSGDKGSILSIEKDDIIYAVELRNNEDEIEEFYLSASKVNSSAELFSKRCDKGATTNVFEPLWQRLGEAGWSFDKDNGWTSKQN